MEMRGNGEIARVDCFCFRSQRQTQAGSNISRINWLVGAGLKDKSLKVYEVDPLNENPSENVNVKLTIPNAHDSVNINTNFKIPQIFNFKQTIIVHK